MIEFWQHIYSHFNPVIFHIGPFAPHWYGLMYVIALLVGLYTAEWIVKHDNINISKENLSSFFIYAEVGIILGARIGYFIFYVPNNSYYLLHPWQMFNPFDNGEFIGIRGMSYHGAVIGFLLATFLFVKIKKQNFWQLMDIVAVAIPAGYIFGRIGNFLNQELIGRVTDVPWGIYVDGTLRHPSQLYEAFFEGLVIFLILFVYRRYKKFDGELIAIYLVLYGIFRSFCEIFRQPDPQLGFIFYDFTMGQILSFSMIIVGILIYIIRKNKQ